MPNTGAIRAGRAFVELFADSRPLVRGLRDAEKKIKAFGSRIRNTGMRVAGIGAALAAPFLAATKVFASMGDRLGKMSARTGVSVEALSELGFAAEQSGSDLESLENGLRRMQRSIYDAGRGLSTAKDALADLGLRFEDLNGLSPEEQFKLLGEALSRIEDPTKRAAIAMALFGRSGTKLLPMFKNGAAGIEALQQEARSLGLTMSGEDARAAEVFTDVMNKLWKTVKMGVFHVGAALAPVLQKVAEIITTVTGRISNWINANRRLVVVVFAVTAAIVAGGVALMALGTIISGLGSAFGALATITATVGAALKVLVATIGMFLSPVGAVIVAVAALGGYLAYASGAGGKALAWLSGRFGVLKDDAIEAYGGIADALAAGDIALAARILWLTLKMEWTRGINFLEKAWLNFRNSFLKIGADAFSGLLAITQTIWHGLEVGWIETTAFFAKTWNGFVGFFARTWERIKAAAKKAWNWIKSLFDDSIDLEAENRLVEQEKQKAIARIDDEQQRKVAEREAQRQRQRQQAAALHEATLAEIGKQNLAKRDALDAEYKARMAENEADLAKARDAWQKALAEARRKRQTKEADKEAAGPEPAKEPPGLDDLLGRIGSALADQADKVSVMGTFNPAAVLGLQAGDAASRTAKATEETARNTKKLLDEVKGADALVFG